MSVYCQNCDHLRLVNKQLEAELARHRKRVSELTSECLEVEGDVSKAYMEINRLKAQLATAKSENRSLCGQLATEMEARTPTLEALHRAKAENEDLCDNIDAARQDMADMRAGTLEGKLWAENERLREDLKLYGDHKDYCGVRWTLESPKWKPCDCGLKQALKQPDEEND